MKQFNLCAAVTALLCVAPLTASNAQSNNELFAPSTAPLTFDDGKQSTTGSFGGLGYEVIGDHAVAEGDMVLGLVDRGGNVVSNLLSANSRGLGLSRLLDRWDNGVIPYKFSDDISVEERSLADQAIAHWNDNTSVSLVEITQANSDDYENYILFEASNGCASYVGMIGGEQQLWISASCGVGSIIHEIGHAVGLFHEHTRSDRDNFIAVEPGNIVPGKEFNFDVLSANVQLLGEYDYGSIMHYGERFFSSNNENTITVLDGVSKIGQRDALSERDIQSVNKLYETDLALSVTADDSSQSGELVADINVTNQGESGANGISLALRLEDGASWSATSQNPGWDCVPNGTLLTCERNTLEATATSVFSVSAQLPRNSSSALAVELTSNTFDTNLRNNGHNATVTQASVESEAPAATIGAANTDDEADQTETASAPETAGGGFANPPATTVAEQSPAPATSAAEQPAAEQSPTVASTPDEQAESNAVASVDENVDESVEENVQQSSQPIVPSVSTGNAVAQTSAPAATGAAVDTSASAQVSASPEPVELAAALPEAEIAAATPSSSSGGGAFSPLGAIALFLLTFVARVRRTKHG